MQGKYEANQVDISRDPMFKASVFVGTLGASTCEEKEGKKHARAQDALQKKKTKAATTSAAMNPPPELVDIEEEFEEEVATHLGGAEPLTGHITMANASSEEDGWKIKWALLSPSSLSFLN